MHADSGPNPLQKMAPIAVGLTVSFSSMELAPGWGGFGLDWPPETYYAIVAAVAAYAGAIAVRGYSIPGLIAGPVCGMSALATTIWHLTLVSETWNWLMLIVGVVGALPGIGLFFLLKAVQDAISPPASGDESPATPVTAAWLERQSK